MLSIMCQPRTVAFAMLVTLLPLAAGADLAKNDLIAQNPSAATHLSAY